MQEWGLEKTMKGLKEDSNVSFGMLERLFWEQEASKSLKGKGLGGEFAGDD